MYENKLCSGWEVVCPDGLVRHFPYHNLEDADAHATKASDPAWFAKRRCRLAPKPSDFEMRKPPCPGGAHHVRPIVLGHGVMNRAKA